MEKNSDEKIYFAFFPKNPQKNKNLKGGPINNW